MLILEFLGCCLLDGFAVVFPLLSNVPHFLTRSHRTVFYQGPLSIDSIIYKQLSNELDKDK